MSVRVRVRVGDEWRRQCSHLARSLRAELEKSGARRPCAGIDVDGSMSTKEQGSRVVDGRRSTRPDVIA